MVVLLFQYRICITDSTYFKIKYMMIQVETKLRKPFKEAPLKQLTYLADVYKHTFLSNGVSSFQAIALSDCFLLSFSDNTDTQVSSNTRVFSYHG